MKKIRYILLLLLNTAITTAVYYFLLNILHFLPTMAIYQILSIVAVCGYLLMVFKLRNDMGKAALSKTELPKDFVQKKQESLKLYMVFAFPFLFTVLIDYIYLVFFVDNPMLESLFNTLK